MLPIGEILIQAGRLLKHHPALFLPVVAGALADSMIRQPASSAPVLVAMILLHLALTTGQLSMVRGAYLGEVGAWDAFLVGVGRHFAPILAGTLVQVSLGALTLVPIILWLNGSVGTVSQEELRALAATGQLDPARIEVLAQWAAAICAWAAVWGILLFFLSMWYQAVVARALGWLRAWQASVGFVRGHWLPMSGLLALQGVGQVASLALVATRLSGLQELGLIAVLLVNGYFAVAMMVAIIGPAPEPKGENVDATA